MPCAVTNRDRDRLWDHESVHTYLVVELFFSFVAESQSTELPKKNINWSPFGLRIQGGPGGGKGAWGPPGRVRGLLDPGAGLPRVLGCRVRVGPGQG